MGTLSYSEEGAIELPKVQPVKEEIETPEPAKEEVKTDEPTE